jgi:hypothetical protein
MSGEPMNTRPLDEAELEGMAAERHLNACCLAKWQSKDSAQHS